MVDQETFERLLPLAYQWARNWEGLALAKGVPLGSQQLVDAELAGVQDCARVRVLVVDRIPMPEDPELADAARRSQIIVDASRCVGFGYAIIIRADAWSDRELLVHNLVHIAQCERTGGLEQWVYKYLWDRRTSPEFSLGHLEEEARRLARKICNGEMPTAASA